MHQSNIQHCFADTISAYHYVIAGDEYVSNCGKYTPVITSNNLGYMYYDNVIVGDTTLVSHLNRQAQALNGSGNTYSYWARPGLAEINGDLPVLLLDDNDGATIYKGQFRSVATYDRGALDSDSHPVLQYGGPVRDGDGYDGQLEKALVRMTAGTSLFIYGDIDENEVIDATDIVTTNTKVSIHEDAAIMRPGTLKNYGNTYVGVSFDNSCSQAASTPGINYGLNNLGMGPYNLPRDWHMFSSPLRNVPLGFNYNGDNEKSYTGGNYSSENRFNNPWESTSQEFNWLTSVGSPESYDGIGHYRYWMKTDADGYFPYYRGALFSDPDNPNKPLASQINDLFVVNSANSPSDECFVDGLGYINRYPYGMDLYTWTEPDYHWINFKRNGPNHWKSDGNHEHIDYEPVYDATKSQNEDNLIVGRGYMASIAMETFMQSHGMLNAGDQSINLTYTDASKLPGWNLVGNPYHGYLDFKKVAANATNAAMLDHHMNGSTDEGAFYVVYNADAYDKISGVPSTAFRYYPVNGSTGGEYAERYLHPHQGFYVMAKKDPESGSTLAGSLTFTQDMVVTRDTVERFSTGSHFRSEQPAYPLVNLYLSSDKGCADVTVIEFERPEWGGATKLKELRVGNGLFYAHHDNDFYAACFAQEGTDRVPLWFEAKEDDIFTIKWNTANGDFHSMYLIDNITGIQYDMLRNDTYTFEGHKNDYWSRFLIVFDVTDVDENHSHDLFVFFDGSEWVVTGEGDLEFIDVLGHVLMRTHVNDGQSRVRLPKVASGMYLMRLTNGDACKTQKVFVNNK